MIQAALAALFGFAILTLWVPAYWPVATFQVGVFTLAGVLLWRAFRSYTRLAFPFFPLLFAVLWGLMQLSTGRTIYRFETVLAVLRWATFLAVFFIASNIFSDRFTGERFRKAMILFTGGVAILATVQDFSSGGKVFWFFSTPYPDVMGPILSQNHFAAFVEAVLPMAAYEAVVSERDSLLYSGMAAAMFASVVASGSRAGVLLAVLEIAVVLVLVRMRGLTSGRPLFGTVLRVAILFAVFSAAVGWEHVWVKLMQPDPMASRREFAISTLHIIRDNPLVGVGLGTWPAAYPKYAIVDVGSHANQAHNDWLQWAAEGGLPLGILMVTVFIWTLRPAFRSIWGIGAIAVFLHALGDYPFSRPALGSWPFLILGMLACYQTGYGALKRRSAPGRHPSNI
jgi:O-antigen ligase